MSVVTTEESNVMVYSEEWNSDAIGEVSFKPMSL
jgi:hypothetical protein